jgi:hypothetical protein
LYGIPQWLNFWKIVALTAFTKANKIVLTLSYAKSTLNYAESAESSLPVMVHFDELQLYAMQHGGRIFTKNVHATVCNSR